VSVVSVIVIIVGVVIVSGSIRKSSLSSPAALAVDCVSDCDAWEVEAKAGELCLVGFSVVSLVLVVGVVIVDIGIQKSSSSLLSMMLVVECISVGGSWELVAMGRWSRLIVFAGSSLFSNVVVIVGCFIFSVMVVVSVVVIISGVIGIGGVVSIVDREVVVSRIKPARMLAFNASRSMRCGGTVLGREGGGVAWDFSEGWSGGGRLFGVASQSMRVCSLSVVA